MSLFCQQEQWALGELGHTPATHHLDSFTAKQPDASIIMVAKNFTLEAIFF